MTDISLCSWRYDESKGVLVITLPSGLNKETTLSKKFLNYSVIEGLSCDMQKLEKFNQFATLLNSLGFHSNVSEKLAYSAIAAMEHIVPNQPKSWYFNIVNETPLPTHFALHTKLQLKEQPIWINSLLCAVDGEVATCLLLDESLSLPGLHLLFGEPFRVFINRLVVEQQVHQLSTHLKFA